jgi:hypothetical protein
MTKFIGGYDNDAREKERRELQASVGEDEI